MDKIKIEGFSWCGALFKVKIAISLFDRVNFYGLGEIFKIKGVLFLKIKISPTSFYQDFER